MFVEPDGHIDAQLSTLYVLHRNTSPGFVHSLTVSVSGPADRPALRKWYEPPSWVVEIEPVWIQLFLVVTIGSYMGWWLMRQLWTGSWTGGGEYVEAAWFEGEL